MHYQFLLQKLGDQQFVVRQYTVHAKVSSGEKFGTSIFLLPEFSAFFF